MYRCGSCGHEFSEDEFDFVTETHGLDTPPYERFAVCPRCGSGDYEEYLEEENDEQEFN